MLTKAQLEKDKADLEKQREQLLAQVNAVSGAIQYIADKLAQLETGDGEQKE